MKVIKLNNFASLFFLAKVDIFYYKLFPFGNFCDSIQSHVCLLQAFNFFFFYKYKKHIFEIWLLRKTSKFKSKLPMAVCYLLPDFSTLMCFWSLVLMRHHIQLCVYSGQSLKSSQMWKKCYNVGTWRLKRKSTSPRQAGLHSQMLSLKV